MPKAGYCSECGAKVPLREDGGCEYGHPAASISRRYYAAPAAAHAESAQAKPPSRKRSRRFVVGAIGVALVVVVLGAVGAVFLRPLADKGSAAAGEWDARLTADYPGWRKVGFYFSGYSGDGGSESTYTFALVPPGRDFPVSVAYHSSGGSEPVSQDEVLRPGARFASRSASLLDYIDANYVEKGRTVASVTSDEDGEVTVTWRKTSGFLVFNFNTGSFDVLKYNEDRQAWGVSFSPRD